MREGQARGMSLQMMAAGNDKAAVGRAKDEAAVGMWGNPRNPLIRLIRDSDTAGRWVDLASSLLPLTWG